MDTHGNGSTFPEWMRPGEPARLTEPSDGPAGESELGFVDMFVDGQVLARGVSSGLGLYPAENVSNEPPFTETERGVVERAKRSILEQRN